jgi:hypothetical protein
MSDWQESGRKLNIVVELLNVTQKEIRLIFLEGVLRVPKLSVDAWIAWLVRTLNFSAANFRNEK